MAGLGTLRMHTDYWPAEGRPNNIEEFGPYLKTSKLHHYKKNQFVNAV
jgi:hypothetical protein